MQERTLGSRTIYRGRILTLRVDEVEAADGHRSEREIVEHAGAVGVVVVHDGDLVLVRQWRHACGEALLEIPAGKLDGGEDPEDCAIREVGEEVGLRPRSIEHWTTYYTTPGFTDEKFHLFFADDLEATPSGTDEGEVLEVERHPAASVDELLRSGQVRDAKSLLGLALYALRSRGV